MWLLRGLSFTCKSLQHSQANKTEELSVAFNKGYEGSLKKHHNFVVKGVFAVRFTIISYLLYRLRWSQEYLLGGHESLPVPKRFLR